MMNHRRNPAAEPPDKHRTSFDFAGELALSTAIVYAVSAVTGRDPRTAPLLSDVIDPVALDRLFSGSTVTGPGGTVKVGFTYDGCSVTVHSEGWIEVLPVAGHGFC